MAAAIKVGSPACSARPEACSGMWGHRYAKKPAAEAAPQKMGYVKNHKVESVGSVVKHLNGSLFASAL